MRHATVRMKTVGGFVEVDEGVIDLVKTMNSIPGIQTTYSCEGAFGPGYVSFGGVAGTSNDGSTVRFLQRVVELMSLEARKHSALEAKHLAEHGPRHGSASLALHFTIELGNSCVMRWFPATYPVLVSVVSRIAKEMRRGK